MRTSSLRQFLRAIDAHLQIAASSIAASVLMLLPEKAMAQDNAITEALCTIIEQLSGPVGRGIAVVAVIFLGFSLFLGKITWGLAIALAIGIAAIFGAGEIVELLGGGGDECGGATR